MYLQLTKNCKLNYSSNNNVLVTAKNSFDLLYKQDSLVFANEKKKSLVSGFKQSINESNSKLFSNTADSGFVQSIADGVVYAT
jgi:hypothetical protein